MTHPNRFVLLALAGLACASPAIESAGGKKGGKGGGSGEEGGGGSAGKSGGGGDGTGGTFTVNFGDGGIPDVPPSINPIGEGPSCAGQLHEAKPVPVDLLMLVDISGSMEESAGTQSKWMAMHDALLTFVKDPMSAGLGVGLETFPPPSKKCAADADCGAGYCEEKGVCSVPAGVATQEVACNDGPIACTNEAVTCTKYGLCAKSGLRCAMNNCPGGEVCNPRPKFCVIPQAGCQAAAYENPIVAVADLPGAVPALEKALDGIVAQGTTPTTPAVTGALTHLRNRATMNPDRKQVLVLATDGLPTECAPNNSLFAANMALRTGFMGPPSVPTYVVGIFGQNQIGRAQPALNDLAMSGGTGMPFVLTTGNDLAARFLTAIKAIRGATLGCEFAVPKSATGQPLDFDRVNVRVTTPAGPEDLVYVGTAAKCDPMRGGWYYDTDPAMAEPTRVLLCESTCQKVKMSGTSVELRVGCKTIIIK